MMISFTEFVVEQKNQPVAEVQTREFDIPVRNMGYLTEKISKLNKVAAKLKLKAIEVQTIGHPFTKKIARGDSSRPPLILDYVKIKLTGEAPRIAGWTFVGKREPLEGTEGILTKTAPGMEMPGKYMGNAALTCDHCTRGKRRSSTFIIKKGNEHKEVGRMCLRDFLGHDDPGKYADYAASLADLENIVSELRDVDYGGGISRGDMRFDLKEVVAATIHKINKTGFVSRSASFSNGGTATADAVFDHFDPPNLPPRSQYTATQWREMHHIPVTDADRQLAVQAIEWIKNHPNAQRDEFMRNASMIVTAPAVGMKLLSYVTAAVNMFLKEQHTAGARQTLKSTLSNEFVATEGKKIDVEGTVIAAFAYDTRFGTKRVFTIRVDNGSLLKMFTMSGGAHIVKDTRVNVTGVVGTNEVESYERSPFKGMNISTMAPRSRIKEIE